MTPEEIIVKFFNPKSMPDGFEGLFHTLVGMTPADREKFVEHLEKCYRGTPLSWITADLDSEFDEFDGDPPPLAVPFYIQDFQPGFWSGVDGWHIPGTLCLREMEPSNGPPYFIYSDEAPEVARAKWFPKER